MGMKDNMRQALIELKGAAMGEGPRGADGDETLPHETDIGIGDFGGLSPAEPIAGDGGFAPPPTPLSSTRISEDTTIWGNIRSSGNVELHGALQGDVDAKGSISIIGGRLRGNLSSANVQLIGAAVQGDLNVTGRVSVDSATMVIGNITAQSVRLDGHMRGNLRAEQSTTIQANAVLLGDVETQTISMSEGAQMTGALAVRQVDGPTPRFEDVEVL